MIEAVTAICLCALGWPVAHIALRDGSGRSRLLDSLAWAPGLGALILSIAVFAVGLATNGAITRTPLALAAAATLILMSVCIAAARRLETPALPLARLSRREAAALIAAIALALGFAAWEFLRAEAGRPIGEWDAFAIWNVRARFLSRGEGPWPEIFRPFPLPIGHPDYPLLVPGTIAGGWIMRGDESIGWPATVGFTFLSALFLAVASAAAHALGKNRASAAVLVLAATPHVTMTAQAQLADVPLAYFLVLAAAGLASRHAEDPRLHRSSATIGLALMGAIWTKNEGVLWAALLLTAHAILLWMHRRTQRARAISLFAAVVAALPIIAAAVLFKVYWAPTNDLVRDGGGTLMSYLSSADRWRVAVRGYLTEVLPYGMRDLGGSGNADGLLPQRGGRARWGAAFFLIVVTSAAWLFRRQKNRLRDPGRFALIAALLAHAAIIVIYVVTPREQAWHIETSLNRLLLQIFPGIVLATVASLPLDESHAAAEKEKRPGE